MQKSKKIILGLGIFFSMLIALVIGIGNIDTTTKVKQANIVSLMEVKPQGGGVSVEKGDGEIHFEYNPQISAGAVTKAYEYIFTNPMSSSTALGVKPVSVPSGVTVAYKASTTQLSTSSLTSGSSTFPTTTLASGAKVYAYVIVTASSASTALSFTSSVTWYYGKPGTMVYNINGSVTSQDIVKNQYVYQPADPTIDDGLGFIGWYKDSSYTTKATFPFRSEGTTLYGKIGQILDSSWFHWDSSKRCYYVKRGGDYSSWATKDIIIPETYNDGTHGVANVTYIYGTGQSTDAAFYWSGVTSVVLPKTLTDIQALAFYNTPLKSINLDHVTTIGSGAFRSTNLTNVVIGSVTSMGTAAFGDCASLNTVIIEEGATEIGNHAFIDSALKSISISSTVTEIQQYAFSGCTNLSTVTFASNSKLDSIGTQSFYKCSSLTTITIPSSVTKIWSSVFMYSGLTSITFNDTSTWYRAKSTQFNNMSGGTVTDVTDPIASAEYFTSTYKTYYWYKK